MKKWIVLLTAALLLLSLAACGGSAGDNAKPAAPTTTKAGKLTTENGKTLVVYFSATGSTKAAAETIAETLDADLFEITPEKPYTADDLDYNDKESRVSIEHDDETKRAVALQKTTPDNWEQYDTVYVGYPIWWGIAAWPVESFVKANDFAGKTVIPFCTSASSGLGSSADRLKTAATGGDWQEGKRFSSSADEKTVAAWATETAGQ